MQTAAPAPRPAARRVPVSQRPQRAIWPYFLALVVMGFALAVAITYLATRGNVSSQGVSSGPENRGNVVATVNGQPIYSQDYQERVNTDKQNDLADPMFAQLANNFQGITGTRMLDVLSSDALDKLINMEVIMQDAQKEGLYPSQQEQQTMVDNAKKVEIPDGNVQAFFQRNNITEGQYDRRVIENFVYVAVASKHVPTTGTADEQTNAFIQWICDTRKNYDVKIFLTFQVQNEPCTSGLPSDYPLPSLNTATPAPEEQPTAAAPLTPTKP